jgi:hypothetical protein
MEIRKADSKGRVTVSMDGEVYSVLRNDDGSITLIPVKIPSPPVLDNNSLRAIYWEPAARPSQPDRVYIHSVIGGSITSNADWVAKLANELMVPVVVSSAGVGAAALSYLSAEDRVAREVIGVR